MARKPSGGCGQGGAWPSATHPQEHSSPPLPSPLEAREGQPLGVCQWKRLGPGHRTQGLGARPHGEGWGGRGVQGSGADARRRQQAVPLEEAGEQQEELHPSQALPHTDSAACEGNGDTGGGPGLLLEGVSLWGSRTGSWGVCPEGQRPGIPEGLGACGPLTTSTATCREGQEGGPLHEVAIRIQKVAWVELVRGLPLCLVQEH